MPIESLAAGAAASVFCDYPMRFKRYGLTTSSKGYSFILGALYGQAAGDAMGMPSELWPQQQVRCFFGWIDDFLPGPAENFAASEFAAGEFTDDTQQAIALMDALIAADGEVEPERIARNIIAWAEGIDAFNKNILGPSSKAALLAILSGQSIDTLGANGVTNGAAMRVAPLGCLLSSRDRQAFIRAVRLSCSPTHQSDIAVAGATAIAWAVSRAVEGAAWSDIKTELPAIADQAQLELVTTFSPLLSRRLAWGFEVAGRLRGQDDAAVVAELYHTLGAGMDTIESVPAALALVECAQGDPRHCAVLAANLGGDTDTIGAMATAVCGALRGVEAIPAAWRERIRQVNGVDFESYAQTLSALRFKG